MPSVGSFHRVYWRARANTPPPPVIGRPGYAGWQASVVSSLPLGPLGAWLDVQLARFRWWWALVTTIYHLPAHDRELIVTTAHLPTERLRVLRTVITTLDSPLYPVAKRAVRETSQTLGFNRPEAWVPYSRELKSEPARAENVFRHLHCMRLIRDYSGVTLSNPEQNLLAELAYHEYGIQPWNES